MEEFYNKILKGEVVYMTKKEIKMFEEYCKSINQINVLDNYINDDCVGGKMYKVYI